MGGRDQAFANQGNGPALRADGAGRRVRPQSRSGVTERADHHDRVARPRAGAREGTAGLPQRRDGHRPLGGAAHVSSDQRAPELPRQRRHAPRDPAGELGGARAPRDPERAEEPARARPRRRQVGEVDRQRLPAHVLGGEPAQIEMDALDHRVGGGDQLHSRGRGHRCAVASRPEADALAPRERPEERLDQIEFSAQLRGISSPTPGGSTGTISVKVEPLPSSLRTETSPPCASM